MASCPECAVPGVLGPASLVRKKGAFSCCKMVGNESEADSFHFEKASLHFSKGAAEDSIFRNCSDREPENTLDFAFLRLF